MVAKTEKQPSLKAQAKSLFTKKQVVLISLTTMTVLAAVAVAVAITLYCFKHKKHFHGLSKSADIAELYQHGAVAADSVSCSEIGSSILKRNGTAVDAAVAVSFCLGLFSMHSTGVGGGGFMLVYSRKDRTVESFDYRAIAPGKAREDMFVDDFNKSRVGGLAIAVPGEVKGLHEAWKKYGKLPWKQLLQPAINLSMHGFQMPLRLYEAMHMTRAVIEKDPGLNDLFFKNGKATDLGSTVKSPSLAVTLQAVADNPEDFYTGPLAEDIVKDIQDAGGICTLDDMANYKIKRRKVLMDDFGDYTLYTLPSPSGGPSIAEILNILKGYSFTPDDLNDPKKDILTYHRIIEAFKFAYADRTKMGDPAFMDKERVEKHMEDVTSFKYTNSLRQKITDDETHNISYYGADHASFNDKGTTHISIYAPDGDAVSLTSTINEWFGSSYRSRRTGIIYNNEMDDFSTPGFSNRFGFPPTATNYIRAGKRPLSSMAPCIIVDKHGDVKMVVGGSGGTRIITATAFVIMHKFWFGDELGHAVGRARLHHQLIPDTVVTETKRALPDRVIKGLEKLGHKVITFERPEYSAVQAIYVEALTKIFAKSDPRKYGHSAGY